MPEHRNLTFLILGGLSIFALLSYFFVFKSSLRLLPIASFTGSEKKKKDDQEGDKNDGPDVIVDDESDDDSDDEDQNDKGKSKGIKMAEESFAENREKFDAALRLAKKNFEGGRFAQAAAKYTDAISLAQTLPNVGNQLTSLYNNRSAMYEKNTDLDLSLSDINVVLVMEPFHSKARLRRARIYEAKNRMKDALKEYTVCQLIDRFQSGGAGAPPAYVARVDEIVREISGREGEKEMKNIQERRKSLPGKVYCRNFLECFPSIHHWRDLFFIRNKRTRESVQGSSSLSPSLSAAIETGDLSLITQSLQLTYELVWFDLVHGSLSSWQEAFSTIRLSLSLLNSPSLSPSLSLSLWKARLLQLCCAESMLLANSERGEREIREALSLCPLPKSWDEQEKEEREREKEERMCAWESVLMLCTVLVERKKSDEEVSSLLSAVLGAQEINEKEREKEIIKPGASPEEKILRIAWGHIHMASFKTRKNEKGLYRQGSAADAMINVRRALEVTVSPTTGSLLAVRLITLHKTTSLTLTVSTMEKMQLGYQEPPNREELEAAKTWLSEANKLAHSCSHTAPLCTILQMEAELSLSTGDIDTAVSLAERAVQLAESDDSVPLVNKGSILLQKAMHEAQDPNANPQLMKESVEQAGKNVRAIFEQALLVEPHGVEALAQLGHLHTMMGDTEGALVHIRHALEYARSLEEAVDLSQMLITTQAQTEAMKELQSLQSR
eukprot:CAMPEP_0182420554 /NCGR_PEP_ID=MMETSP1167-20130531/5422_1 /TAXON_ID=2988 /ORGANISM="Mallomonas Sp, Strain CCMP3275" /LENGTH=725 /DNA_ID=CAMNT_0024596653 /DNA_START=69 /DNA_END=2246 /DNA_ORIENTATION=+